jgi:hypothetical protein
MHTLDICHPLHIPHTIEPERLRHALNFLVSRKSRVFTKSDRIAGLHLVPDDLEWSWGAAQPCLTTLLALGFPNCRPVCCRQNHREDRCREDPEKFLNLCLG